MFNQKVKADRSERLEELDSYFREIRSYRSLTRAKEAELAKRIREGDERALDQLVKANLKFVVSTAKAYRDSGVRFSDIIEAGNLGLVKAARKFDETRGVKFISYAVHWIKRSITDCIEEHNAEQAQNIDPFTLENAEDGMGEYDEFSQIVNNEFEEEMSRIQGRNAAVEDMLSVLKEREARILQLYFGLTDGKEMTLDEIGQELNITKERVRQLKDKAIVKLKHHALMSDEFDTYKELS